MRNLRTFALIAILALSVIAHSDVAPRTIVVTDIDDTIRHTHVRPEDAGLFSRAKQIYKLVSGLFKSNTAFVGMPELYNSIAATGAEIHYVSGAPQILSFVPEKFLEAAGFPQGELWLRPTVRVATQDFKLSRIAEIIESDPQARIILIGDNGEADAETYRKLQADPRFAGRIEGVYIHKLYGEQTGQPGQPLAFGQKAFFTSADLARELNRGGFLGNEATLATVELVEQARTLQGLSCRALFAR